MNLAIDSDNPERVGGVQASTELFQVLSTDPMLGRTFDPDDGIPGANRVVLLSYQTWRLKLGADPGAVGREVRLEGLPFTVVGVMPDDFYFPNRSTEVWVPLAVDPERAGARGAHNRQVIGRLKSGVTLSEAQAEMAAISARLVAEYPENYPEGTGFTAKVRPLREPIVENSRPAVLALMAAVGFVLLIACANVASLFLARGAARERELALRAALGAKRSRLVRQLVTETLVVALLGGAAGLVLALAGVEALRLLDPGDIPGFAEIGIDLRMVAFTFALTLATGLLFGLVPAVQATRSDPNNSLKEGPRVSGLNFARRVRGSLVVLETAVALMLLIGAGLMVRSFLELVRVDSGLDPRQVTAASVSPSAGRYTNDEQIGRFYETLLDDLRNQPGVEEAGAVSVLPFSGSREDIPFGVEDHPTPSGEPGPSAEGRVVAGDYFTALGIPLVRGRFLEVTDTAESPEVVVVSQSVAEQYWGSVDVVGKRIKLWSSDYDGPWKTVVGVVGDVHHLGLDQEFPPIIYYPHKQPNWGSRSMTVVLRASGDAAPMRGLIAQRVLAIDSEQAVYNVKTMEEYMRESTAQTRFSYWMLSLIAVLALVLAAVGQYGIVAQSAASRTHEIGIRMALGARKRGIFDLVVREGLSLVMIGVVLGLLGASFLSGLMSTLLFGGDAMDPWTYGLLSVVLIVVALAACYIPACRAMRVDPMVALRYE